MARFAFPAVPPGVPLYRLMVELHDLHARAGRPSLDKIVARQTCDKRSRDHFGRDAVHRLFSKTREAPPLPLLYEVVRILATLAPKMDVEEVLDRFDRMWLAADRYDALQLNLHVPREEDLCEPDAPRIVEARGDRDE